MNRNLHSDTDPRLRRAEGLLWDTMEYLESQGYDETEEYRAIQSYFGLIRYLDMPDTMEEARGER